MQNQQSNNITPYKFLNISLSNNINNNFNFWNTLPLKYPNFSYSPNLASQKFISLNNQAKVSYPTFLLQSSSPPRFESNFSSIRQVESLPNNAFQVPTINSKQQMLLLRKSSYDPSLEYNLMNNFQISPANTFLLSNSLNGANSAKFPNIENIKLENINNSTRQSFPQKFIC